MPLDIVKVQDLVSCVFTVYAWVVKKKRRLMLRRHTRVSLHTITFITALVSLDIGKSGWSALRTINITTLYPNNFSYADQMYMLIHGYKNKRPHTKDRSKLT
jgi:hypothetical protein